MGTLREKIRAREQGVIFYELIPPVHGTAEEVVETYAECAAQVVAASPTPIDAINLPEIREERRGGRRTYAYEPKADPREFGRLLQERLDDPIEIVINRCTVYEDWPTHHRWLGELSRNYGFENLVLVGGESSRVHYPGPSVTEMARTIRETYRRTFLCGGITIPTRRKQNPQEDEPMRLVTKARHGMEFFTTQIIYEAESTQALLRAYQETCDVLQVAPKRILLSFAPVSSAKDLEFVKWLGVEVPPDVEETLLKADMGIGWRSLQIARRVLGEILEFCVVSRIEVPLGLNVEHVTRRNFELSKEFLEQLGPLYLERVGRAEAEETLS